jgi:hypothetical protein
VIPSVDEAAIVVALSDVATKTPVVGLQVTAHHLVLAGKTRWVHVIPSVDDAAIVELSATATKIPVFGLHATADHPVLAGNVL